MIKFLKINVFGIIYSNIHNNNSLDPIIVIESNFTVVTAVNTF